MLLFEELFFNKRTEPENQQKCLTLGLTQIKDLAMQNGKRYTVVYIKLQYTDKKKILYF